MKLEAAIKHFSPKSQIINDSPRSTSSNTLTSSDISAALGIAEAQASFGISAYLGKHGVSNEDRIRAVAQLTQYAKQQAPKHVGKAAGKRLAQCMAILAKLAYTEYSGSAASTYTCSDCRGGGFFIDNEGMKRLCKPCNGKGSVSNRCRCNGTGKVLDREKTKTNGYLVIKVCKRCAGRGYKRVPASVAYAAISVLLPKLTQSTWSRNWKPFYESLVTKCYVEESKANTVFNEITA